MADTSNMAKLKAKPPIQTAKKGTKPAILARRVRMAGAKANGRSTAAIARAEGVTRAWASRELASDDCRQVILGLVNANSVPIERLFQRSLTAIDQAFDARRTGTSEGAVIDLGEDHYARLAAVKRLIEVTCAGRSPARQPEGAGEKRPMNLQELDELFGTFKGVQ